MKNCASGEKKQSKVRLGLFVAILMSLSWPSLNAAPARRAWVFEQLSSFPNPQPRRNFASLSGTSLGQTFSTQLIANANLSLVEVGISGSQRLYSTGNVASLEQKQLTNDERQTLSVHIGRYVLSSEDKYGRLALSYHSFIQDGQNRWIGVHMDTGILPKPERIWSARFHLGTYIPLTSSPMLLQIFLQVAHPLALSKNLVMQLGLDFRTSINLRVNGPGLHENFFISLGPHANLPTSIGNFDLAILWRFAIDQNINGNQSAYLTAFEARPDINLKYTFVF